MKRRRLAWTSVVIALTLFAFGYGVLVGKYQIFPYELLARLRTAPVLRAVGPSDELNAAMIQTTFVPLAKRVLNNRNFSGLSSYGGGLALLKGEVIGVDSRGRFFSLSPATGDVTPFELGLSLNESEFVRYLETQIADADSRQRALQYFRVLDIEVRDLGESAELFVSHNHWDGERNGKTTRVSRLMVDSVSDLTRGALDAGPDDWEVLFESDPVIAFDATEGTPFWSNRSGGRMVIEGREGLLLALGDHSQDGVQTSVQASQDSGFSYGKIIRISLDTGQSRIFATGVRNPQGLFVDRDGSVWSTEHGPKGGDELNLIVEGENYGWPLVTYGANYGSYEWPLNDRQGRHAGYREPAYAWVPSIGISSAIQINGQPAVWDGDLLISALEATSLFRTRIEQGRVLFVEPIPVGDRVRDLIQLADGRFLLWTDSRRFIELTVVEESSALTLPVALTAEEQDRGLPEVLQECASCHSLSPGIISAEGPTLWGVYGRRIGGGEFEYSPALQARSGIWDDPALDSYLADPQTFAPGTAMSAPFLSQETREAVVGYLRRLQ